MAQDPLKAALAVLDEPDEQADPLAAALAVLDEPEPPQQYQMPLLESRDLRGMADVPATPDGPVAIEEMTRSVGRGAAQAGIGVAQGALLTQEAFDRVTEALWERLLSYDVEGVHGGRETAGKLQAVKEGVLPARGERGFWTHDLMEGFGQALAYMGGGALGGPAGLGATAVAAGFAEGFYDAEAHGATEEEKWASALANGGLSLTELVGPLPKILARFNLGTGGSLRQAMVRMLTEGGQEAIQEVVQGAGSNIVAKGLYAEEREILAGLKTAGPVGFLVGAILSGASSGVARTRAQMKATEGAARAEPMGGDDPAAAAPSVSTPGDGSIMGPIEFSDPGIAGPVEESGPPSAAVEGPVATDVPSGPSETDQLDQLDQTGLDAEPAKPEPMSADNYQVVPLEDEAAPTAEVEPPATPEAAAEEAEQTVSVMNRKMDEDMAALGMEPGKRAEPTTEKAWDDEAARVLKDDPFAGQKLLDDLRAKPRAPSGTETAILTREMVRMSLERDRLNQEIIDAYESGSIDRAETLEERAGKLVEAWGSAADVLAYAGSESGRSLRARQMTMALDYSLVAMERAKRAANKGAPLTAEQSQEIQELHGRINKLQQDLAQSEAASDERVKLLEEQIDTLIKGKSKERKRARRAESPALTYISNQAAAARERIKARGTQLYSGIPLDVLTDYAIIGAEYIAKGVADLTAWSKAMVTEFGEAIKPHLDAIRAQAETKETEAKAESIKAKSEGGVRDAAVQIRKLAESFIESGVTEREPLIDSVHEVLVKVDPDITRRETMDLMSGYGDFKPLSKEAVKVRLRELRGEMQQLAKLEDMLQKGELPLRSGVEHATPSDEARRLQQQVNEVKRRLNLQPVGDPETHLRSALEAIKTRLGHQIADLQHQIDSGQQILKERTKPKTDAEIDALREQRDALQTEYDAIFNPPEQAPGRTEVMRAKAAEKATEKAIKDYEKRIREGEVAVKARTPGFSTPALDALRARRDALAEELANLRMAQMTEAEKDARANKAFKTRAMNEIARLREKVAAEDFAPKPKRNLKLDDEATAIKAQLEQAQQEYRQGLEADRRRNMTTGQKAWMYGKEVFNIRRALFASYDLSALLRQGKWIVWSHPIESARAAKVMLRSLASEDYYQKVMAAVREQAHSGLYIAEVDAKLSAREEEIRSNLADKIPGMRASNRAFTALLNVMRVKIHAQMAASTNAAPGSAAAKYYAEYVNIATGRGEPGRFASAANAAAFVLWSPRLYLSRIQTLSGWALWNPNHKVTARERMVVAKQYGRAVAGMMAYYAALHIFAQSVLADDDEEAEIGINPLSSDFGKERIGRVRIDPMAGMAQFAVLAARLVVGKTVTTKGDERSLTHYGEKPPGFGQANIEATAGRFLRTKLNPTIGMAIDLRQGANAIGEPIPSATEEPLDFAIWLLAPLSLQGAIEGVQELGWSRGIALGVFEALGDGVQIYGDRTPAKKPAKAVNLDTLYPR